MNVVRANHFLSRRADKGKRSVFKSASGGNNIPTAFIGKIQKDFNGIGEKRQIFSVLDVLRHTDRRCARIENHGITVTDQICDLLRDGFLEIRVHSLADVERKIRGVRFRHDRASVRLFRKSFFIQLFKVTSDGFLRDVEFCTQIRNDHFAVRRQFGENRISSFDCQHVLPLSLDQRMLSQSFGSGLAITELSRYIPSVAASFFAVSIAI